METNSISRWLALALLISLLGASGVPAAVSTGGAGFLDPVRFEQIKINGFWLEQIKLQTEKWLPHCVRQMERGGEGEELLNFIDTAPRVVCGGIFPRDGDCPLPDDRRPGPAPRRSG